ncbi:MAG: serine/threonine protein kinase [bacterium]|nr:serine/threonine protein kinase [bacterium]
MAFCTRCAQALPEGGRFCPSCAAPVPAPVADVPALPAATLDATRSAPAPAGSAATVAGSAPASAASYHGRFETGTRLGTRYRIVALLGRGGMGEVYRADDLELGQSVALKFLPESVSRNAAELARFRNEVRVARQIAHPNVCRVYDIGEIDGHVFLSMEYIDGEDLASVLRRMGRPSSDKAIEIARQVCLGLAAAHEAGMLHRDLKPANVMIDGRGRARITDFGLAGLADELAREGRIAGTPGYMAPEQLKEGRVSARSDIYALGLVLYEIFTGKRAFTATSLADMRQQQESGSFTSLTDLVRDLDPAVERVVLRCLETDPESRPASAYAVLGALPGGDPLAAALAAGETPSPELVANAGDRGGLGTAVAFGAVALGLVAVGLWCGLVGPALRPFTQPASVLSVRASDLLEKSGCFEEIPGHTAEGFDLNQSHLQHLRRDTAEVTRGGSPAFYWRRWSPDPLEHANFHSEVVTVDSPSPLTSGRACVLLDPAGKLVGFQAIPPDSVEARPGGKPDWNVFFAAAGLDSTLFTRITPAPPVPIACDEVAAWKGRLPGPDDEPVTLRMGALRGGRLAWFSITHDWGRSTAPLEPKPVDSGGIFGWIGLMLDGLLSLTVSAYFAVRNLRLGRGDRRGATRLALFVFAVNMLEAVFNTPLREIGLQATLWEMVGGRAMGHSLTHAVQMWLAYVALEPYVRRLWPRMLVSWARLVSGRGRDPLVGRDILVGSVAGAVMAAASLAVVAAFTAIGLASLPTRLSGSMLTSLAGYGGTGFNLSYAASVCILNVLNTLVQLFLLRLALRRNSTAALAAGILIGFVSIMGMAPTEGWPIALAVTAINVPVMLFVLLRFGLLPAFTAAFVGTVMSSTVATLDFSAWYANRALLPAAIFLALLAWGATTAMAGKTVFGDLLHDEKAR